MEASQYFVCVHEFVPEFEDELALVPGDKILVLPSDAGEDTDAWLMVVICSSLLTFARARI